MKTILISAFLLLGLGPLPARADRMPPIRPGDVKDFLSLLRPTSLDQEFYGGYVFTGISVDQTLVSYIFEKGERKCRLTLGDRQALPRAGHHIGFVQVAHSCTPPPQEDQQRLVQLFLERLGFEDRLLHLVGRIGSDWKKPRRVEAQARAAEPPFFPGPLLLGLLGLWVVYYSVRARRILSALRSLSPGTGVFLFLGIAAAVLLTITMNPRSGLGFKLLAASVSSAALLLLYAICLRASRSDRGALPVLAWVLVCPAFQQLTGRDPAGLFLLFFALAAGESYLAFSPNRRIPHLCAACLGVVSAVLLVCLGLLPQNAGQSMLANPELVDPVYLLLAALGVYALLLTRRAVWIVLGLLACGSVFSLQVLTSGQSAGALAWPALFLLVAFGVLTINRDKALSGGRLLALHLLLGAPLFCTQLALQ